MKVAVIGSTNLIATHLIRELEESGHNVKVWSHLDMSMDDLELILNGSEVVFNLHEYKDFSQVPDVAKLTHHNVDFVKILIEKCRTTGIFVVIHLSSFYLQSSYWWPNVNGREGNNYQELRSLVPFPEYCDSKKTAEELIENSDLHSIIARVGPLYGDNDHQSLICDAISLTQYLDPFPTIGDKKGVLQMAYAGNVANALFHCASKMVDSIRVNNNRDKFNVHGFRKSEIVLITDDTPLISFIDLVRQLTGNKMKSNKRCPKWIPHFLFFPLYLMIGFFVRVFGNKFFTFLNQLPSFNYLYLMFHHWTFFSDFKLRVVFDYKPKYSWLGSLFLSRNYYQTVKPEDIVGPSWIALS